MKVLTYKVMGYVSVYNPETEEVEQKPSFAEAIVKNPTDADIARAKETAYNGEYIIEDDGQPEPTPAGEPVTWEELDAAYQEGVDSV